MSSSISSLFSSIFTVVHADSEEKSESVTEASESKEEAEEQPAHPCPPVKEEEGEDKEEEEEEEEPEDISPAIRAECEQSAKCAPLVRHFEHCQEKVQSGKGFKGEDCVEEFVMHCVDGCAAPKLFPKLR